MIILILTFILVVSIPYIAYESELISSTEEILKAINSIDDIISINPNFECKSLKNTCVTLHYIKLYRTFLT